MQTLFYFLSLILVFFLPLFLHVCMYVHMYVYAYLYTYTHIPFPPLCLILRKSDKMQRKKQCQETIGSRTRTITNYFFFSYQNIVNHFSSKENSFWFSLKYKWMVIYIFFHIELKVPPSLALSGSNGSLEWGLYIFFVHKYRQSSYFSDLTKGNSDWVS